MTRDERRSRMRMDSLLKGRSDNVTATFVLNGMETVQVTLLRTTLASSP